MHKKEICFDVMTLPPGLQPYARGARIFDSSCSDTAQTLYLEGSVPAYLKINQAGKLLRESRLLPFFHQHQLGPRVLAYICENNRDYLLTAALEGEDGISGGHLDNPKLLAAVFGESLRLLHSLPIVDCPLKNRSAEILLEATANVKRQVADLSIVPEGIEPAFQKLLSLAHLALDDVVLHGDYCLPNIIMQNYKLQGFVDLAAGGVGDRHYDLFWGIWTLHYNLKTNTYKDIFLDAYGRQDIDPDRLEMCRLLAGLTE